MTRTYQRNQRNKKLVDRPVQIAVVRRFLVHVALFMLVGSAVTMITQYLADPFQGVSSVVGGYWQQAGPFLVVLLAMLPVFVWDTIKLTNRIVGPMVRLRATLRQVNAGQLPASPLRFREDDFWHDLADELNVMIQRVHQPAPGGSSNGSGQAELEPDTVSV